MTEHHHHKPKCYQYKNYWIEIFLDFDEERDRVVYFASVEFPNNGGAISLPACSTSVEAELAADRLIDAGESELKPR